MWPLCKIIDMYQFLEYILKENYFTFNDKLYLQKHGTAMGTKMAPSFANIFMGALEQTLLSSSPNHLIPLLWKRFMDDIWTHSEESFQSSSDISRAGARTLIGGGGGGGVYIHIFRFCRLVSFVIKLISKEISRA